MDISKYKNNWCNMNRKYEFTVKELGVSNDDLAKYHVFHDEYDIVFIWVAIFDCQMKIISNKRLKYLRKYYFVRKGRSVVKRLKYDLENYIK